MSSKTNESVNDSMLKRVGPFIENFFYEIFKCIIGLTTFALMVATFCGFGLCSWSIIATIITGFDEPTLAYTATGLPLWLVAILTFVIGGLFAGFVKGLVQLK